MEEEKYPSKLTKGSKYRVTSRGSGESNFTSTGEFMGYVQFGQDSGICIKIESDEAANNGTLRIIPSMSVLLIDVILQNTEKDETKKNQPDSIYYS